MSKRAKKISFEQFENIMQREWRPVRLVGDAVPDFLRGIPKERLHSIVASGTLYKGLEYTGKTVPSGILFGGIDVYRNAPEDPVELNKDWYAVIRIAESDTMFLVEGPIKDNEHWLDKIPRHLKNIEILGIPKKPLPKSE
jgi:hypothetical protein